MPGLSGTPMHGDLGLVAVERDAGDDWLVPSPCAVFLESDQRARRGFLVERQSRVVKLESTRSGTRYLPANSTERICSTLEPRLAISSISSKVTVREAARLGHDARVGGVDAVDVGVDLALVGLQRRGERHRRGVGAAAAERGDVAVRRRRPGSRRRRRPCRRRGRRGSRLSSMRLDARLGERAVGERSAPASRCSSRACTPTRMQRDAPAGRPRPARRSRRSCRARAGRAAAAAPWRARAGGWSRRTSPRARRPAGARPPSTSRRGARRSGCARPSPPRCRRICERSVPRARDMR